MQVAMTAVAATVWRRVAAVLVGLMILSLGWGSVSAQDPEIHRFFGFLGDVTIDGEPVGPGSTIAALVDDEVVGETVVNAAGAWILDVNAEMFDGGDCNLTFVVNDLRADTAWETCDMRVRLALISPAAQAPADSAAETTEASDAESSEADQSGASSVDSTSGAGSDGAVDKMEEEMEEEGDGDTLDESEAYVRPTTPLTGTGGVCDEGGSTSWPRTAAITAALTIVAALAALLISRRTDGQT